MTEPQDRPSADAEKIARLEAAVRGLQQQVNVLLSEVRTLAAVRREQPAVPAPSPVPPPATPAATSAPAGQVHVAVGGAADESDLPPIARLYGRDALAALSRPPRERATGGGAGAGAAPSEPARHIPVPSMSDLVGRSARPVDVEGLVGRYGTMALATLTILLGVGTFLRWAIANRVIEIGPAGRVGLGLAVAAVFAWLGWRLRSRGTAAASRALVNFGNTLLAIALAVVHLDAWAAGPYLHVVPSQAALAAAAIASAALAALALSDQDELLYTLGVGGALAAPFVASQGAGNVNFLLVYGWLVVSAGVFAMRGHRWRVALWLHMAAGWAYAGAALGALSLERIPDRAAPFLFTILAGWSSATLANREYRAPLARAYFGAGAALLLGTAFSIQPELARDLLAVAAAAGVSVVILLRADEGGPLGRLTDAFALPLLLYSAAIAAVTGGGARWEASVSAGWTLLAAAAALAAPRPRRPVHWLVAAAASFIGILFALRGEPAWIVVAVALHAVAFSLLLRRERSTLLILPVGLALAAGLSWADALVSTRPRFVETPFLNLASMGALAISLAFWCALWQFSRTRLEGELALSERGARVVRAIGPIPLFFWARAELLDAWSPNAALFLVIAYYVVVGVTAIFVGRARRLSLLRKAGLALAVYAALKVIIAAWDFTLIGWRVLSFLMAGGFMLLVGYWYRVAERGAREDASSAPAAPAAS